jgi:hypothetical protein
VVQDIGVLDFGQGIRVKVNVALWGTRGEHRPVIGEFAFQIRFNDRKESRWLLAGAMAATMCGAYVQSWSPMPAMLGLSYESQSWSYKPVALFDHLLPSVAYSTTLVRREERQNAARTRYAARRPFLRRQVSKMDGS